MDLHFLKLRSTDFLLLLLLIWIQLAFHIGKGLDHIMQ